MLQRPAAILGDISARLLGTTITSNNDDTTSDSSDTETGSNKPTTRNGNTAKKRLSYPPAFIEKRRLNNRNHATNISHTIGTSTGSGTSTPDHHHHHHNKGSTSNIIPDISIAPTNHRENTAIHALKDTFIFPSFGNIGISTASLSSYLPSLPTIPCMSGLGQSNLFNDDHKRSIPIDGPPPRDGNDHFTIRVAANNHERRRRASSSTELLLEDPLDPTTAHHHKAGSLFLSNNNKHDSFDKLEGLNVTMLGGYRGSILRDATSGRRLWVPLKVGFNVRKAELAIGLTEDDELRTTETVVPGKSLAAIAGFVDLGKRLKDRLKQMDKDGQIHFHSWGYDWRRSLELSSAELVAQLEKAKAETGKPILVIAHSMGGLVALHALARASDPTIFKGIIFGSTPFGGTPNILQPFKHGDSILMNKDICSPSTVFSFRSSFYLLPTNKTCFYDPEGQLHPVDFLNAEEWIKYGLSPMTLRLGEHSKLRQAAREDATEADAGGSAPVGVQQLGEGSSVLPSEHHKTSADVPVGHHEETDVPDEEILVYLRRTLANVRKFREELTSLYDLDKKHHYPPLVMLSSTKTPTVKGCLVNDADEIIEGKYDRLLFGEGDGIILHESASALPEIWQSHSVGHIESHNGHVSILSDLNAIRQAIDLVHASSKS